jgi:hypothetical protein
MANVRAFFGMGFLLGRYQRYEAQCKVHFFPLQIDYNRLFF